MNMALRVLSVSFLVYRWNVKYKIAYARTMYKGYDLQAGDEIDHAIKKVFQSKKPQINEWLYIEPYNPERVIEAITYLEPISLPLVISSDIDYRQPDSIDLPDKIVQVSILRWRHKRGLEWDMPYGYLIPNKIRLFIKNTSLAETLVPLV